MNDRTPPAHDRLPSPESPDRGAELAKVINYVQNFHAETNKALEASIRALPGGAETIESLAGRGITLEQAVYLVPDNDGGRETTVGALYYEREQAYARLQYGAALEASGLEIQDGNSDEIHVLMANPESFAEALRKVMPPEDSEQKAGFAPQIGVIVDESLATAGLVIVDQNKEEAEAMCGEYKYRVQSPVYDWFPSPEQAAVGRALPQQADSIAQQLPRLGVSDDTTGQVRALAAAEREGLVTAWGVAQKLGILGKPGERISGDPDKIGYEFYWSVTYRFLAYLRETAPGAQFTHEVRRTILADLDAAAGTPQAQKARQVRERVLGILPD